MAAAPRISLDHIAIAVPRLPEALAALEKVFGEAGSPPEEVASEKVRISFLSLGGARLEVLEATDPESPISRFVEGKRGGVHHLSFRLRGMAIEEFWQLLRSRGVELLGSGPHPGGAGASVFFVHPRSTAGVLVEFSQRPEDVP
jgi:methylmalonyl-CoA/ethylmalonyl-CoA epimerase